MKKPMLASEPVPAQVAKLIFKIHKENTPHFSRMQGLDPLQLVRSAAHQQQVKVALLIQ